MSHTNRFQNDYVDFHCHPALKPFGKSFNYKPRGINHSYRNRLNSIWHYDPPSLTDKLLNYIVSITKFSQANFTSLAKGGISIICASLYPIEKPFFDNKIREEFLKDITANFATGLGKKRIDFIQNIKDYFKDLELEYAFYKQLDGKVIRLPEGNFRYKIVNSYNEIKTIYEQNNTTNVHTICVIMSIEGMHVLNANVGKSPNYQDFLANLKKLKNWEHPPFFVTVAHHFWNYLCGHAESLTGFVKKHVDQSFGLEVGFTDLGKLVVGELLKKDNGKRILIDIKHMSVASRNEYYQILKEKYRGENIPIIVSHGAVNGIRSFENSSKNGSSVAKKLNPVAINFYDEEIIKIAESKGVFGLQLDERRIASKETLKDTKNSIWRSKIMHYRSELLWNQIQHILEVLDNEGLFAWDCMVLGTDFDGIIDPLNAFWTAEEFPFLADFLERHAYNYMKNNTLKTPENNIEADEIVARIMSLNGKQFLETHFN